MGGLCVIIYFVKILFMTDLLEKIRKYWTRRAESYSDLTRSELSGESRTRWNAVLTENIRKNESLSGRKYTEALDVGTGPGFFAILLAKQGLNVTGLDYTEEMLVKAGLNSKNAGVSVNLQRGNACSMDFPDESFDLLVTRNLTWDLESPEDAYKEWYRVLKKGGVLLNFDAAWYKYLFDEDTEHTYHRAHDDARDQNLPDLNDYDESPVMEEISKNLPLSSNERPEIDLELMKKAGFKAEVDREIWKTVWDEAEQVNFAYAPMFMLTGRKD